MALRFLVTHSRLLVLGGEVVPGVPVEDHIGEFIVCQLTVREAALPLPAPKPGVREGPLGAPPCVAPPPASSADQAHSRQPSARERCMASARAPCARGFFFRSFLRSAAPRRLRKEGSLWLSDQQGMPLSSAPGVHV